MEVANLCYGKGRNITGGAYHFHNAVKRRKLPDMKELVRTQSSKEKQKIRQSIL